MPRENDKDCPFQLIPLTDKPKAWREEASRVLIEYYYELKAIKKENKVIIGILMLILGCMIRLAFFPP